MNSVYHLSNIKPGQILVTPENCLNPTLVGWEPTVCKHRSSYSADINCKQFLFFMCRPINTVIHPSIFLYSKWLSSLNGHYLIRLSSLNYLSSVNAKHSLLQPYSILSILKLLSMQTLFLHSYSILSILKKWFLQPLILNTKHSFSAAYCFCCLT